MEETLKQILKTLKMNNLFTGSGSLIALLALVIALIALLK